MTGREKPRTNQNVRCPVFGSLPARLLELHDVTSDQPVAAGPDGVHGSGCGAAGHGDWTECIIRQRSKGTSQDEALKTPGVRTPVR